MQLVGEDGQQAGGTGKTAVERPINVGRCGLAFDVDVAVQTACNVLLHRIGSGDIFHTDGQIQLLLDGIDATRCFQTALLQQIKHCLIDFDHALFVNGEFRQGGAHGNAVVVGKTGLAVTQVQRAI